MREPIRCDCHGTVICAERDGDKIIVLQRRNGRQHIAVIPVDMHSDSEENHQQEDLGDKIAP